MGIRHALGVSSVPEISKILLLDISEHSLTIAKAQLSNNKSFNKFDFKIFDENLFLSNFEYCIIAATAEDRISQCQIAYNAGCKFLLIEKPLGQSIEKIKNLILFCNKKNIQAFVNLNMRIYPDSIKLREDLQNKPQFLGMKKITMNTGAVGIGANGIHYLDFLFFLTNANQAKIIAAKVDKIKIPSARGSNFEDFGGWCMISFFKDEKEIANAFISINPESSVFGGWDIVGSHGRVTINESNGKRFDFLRKSDSKMPSQRYNADYDAPVETNFDSPFLGDLTFKWLSELIKGKAILPLIDESLLSHELLFEWLSNNEIHQDNFPIT